MILIFITVCFL